MVMWRSTGIAGAMVIVLLGMAPKAAEGSAEIISHVTAAFGKALEQCRDESGLSPEIMEEFHHYWREDFEVVHRELGCAIICMSKKFSLIMDDTRIHHDNMEDFIKSFPKGEELSERMLQMIHDCEKPYEEIEDDCMRVVNVARCFKKDASEAGIAPDMAMMEAVLERYN